jgi:two-component system, sensor histidine kinase and response regulator
MNLRGSASKAQASSYPLPAGPSVYTLNREEVLDRVGYDAELLEELVMLFHEDVPLRFAELKKALDQLDCLAFEKAAHALKGMLSNFTSGPAYTNAALLENLGRACVWTDVNALSSELEIQIQQLEKALRGLVHECIPKSVTNVPDATRNS